MNLKNFIHQSEYGQKHGQLFIENAVKSTIEECVSLIDIIKDNRYSVSIVPILQLINLEGMEK